MSYADLLRFFRDKKKPVVSPFRNAVYSDGGFAILGQVLARLSGKTYSEAVQEVIFDPLGLESMSTKVPTGRDFNAIDRRTIDKNTSWGGDIEVVASYVSFFTFHPFPFFSCYFIIRTRIIH
jgi:CubicO group peptidase (beta-lactamase class C family)